MEFIVQILIIFIFINCILKLSFWKPLQTIIFGVICAIFVVVAYPYAIQESKTQIADYLNNTSILQDAAVFITIDSAICFAFCFAVLQDKLKKKKIIYLLYWYPCLLIFPVLYYLLTQAIFAFPGNDFEVIAYLFAAASLVIIPIASMFIKWVCPEKDLRLEVFFLVSLFVCVIGLITTVNGNVTYAATEGPLNIKALVLSVMLFVVAFLIGFCWNKWKWRINKNNNKK